MKPSIIFVHWNAAEAKQLSGPLRKQGWHVTIEHGQGEMKLSELKTHPPLAVVISLCRLPSHGWEFAGGLWGTRWGRNIPIIFFGGEDDTVSNLRKQYPAASFTSYDSLASKLKRLRTKRSTSKE